MIKEDALKNALGKMLGEEVKHADYQTTHLHGGTVGNVQLVTGVAETVHGQSQPYNIILKTQKKWERQGDPTSWRREYDLYVSGLDTMFTDSLRWPVCYLAEMNEEENETQIWMEYIDAISGYDLTVEMLECAAYEIGRFQGKLYAEQPILQRKLTNLSKAEDLKNYYLHYRSWDVVYNYIRSDDCEIPKHLRDMLIEVDDNADEIWERIERLPIVLCHRDFWVTNIFYSDGKILLIDWDTAGWGYMGEDIKSLIADEADIDHMVECYRKCVPAFYKGVMEYADISHISDHCIRELILVNLGYRLVEWFLFAEASDMKTRQISTLQKIFEMKDYD